MKRNQKEITSKEQWLFKRVRKKNPVEKPIKIQIGPTDRINEVSSIFKGSVPIVS